MAQEIERKFLLSGDGWRAQAKGSLYRQGYIATARPGHTVRLRIVAEVGYLTLKGPTQGLTRMEYEYPIPLADVEEMLAQLCEQPQIEKVRYRVPYGDHVWEIDEFLGLNAGLVLAEVEMVGEQDQVLLPDWIGLEVTGDRRYYNSYLVQHPFQSWS